ncbi:hypothetical protein MED01_002490 [Micromonospora sp. MED01]|uniref:hypothetical protein n=1 Tax=Micromonospora alfalfae TaxID=2911212 RepID=UPI001EE90998|nr:hypothetical protein [Micromonospora alfalfae]MCG5464324.1 hypothetical protein [Micromonospora alfalfae]
MPQPGDYPHARPYTDADVKLVEQAILHAEAPIRPGFINGPDQLTAEARAALDALVAAGRLRSSRPTSHLDAVKAERDKLRDANDTLALTLAEAIGTLTADGAGCSRGWIPAATVERWRRALHEAEEARSGR